MKRLKFLPSVLMFVLCVGVLCMGIYAASPNSNQIMGSITINSANAAVDILYWAEKADGTQSTKIPLTGVRTGGEVINFNDTAIFGDFLKLDFSSADEIGDVKPCYIKIEITNNSSTKELGAYFSTARMTEEAERGDIFTTAPMANSSSVTATSLEFYKQMGIANANNNTDTVTLVLEFKATDFIESGDPISFNNYYVNIEEYNANIKTENVTTDQLTAVDRFVKLSSVIESTGASRSEISSTTGFNFLTTLSNLWVVVPNGVTTIGGGSNTSGAFYYSSALTKISLPNTLTTIADYAFSTCYNLTGITIMCTSATIGNGAFDSCSGLVRVSILGGVTAIGMFAFRNCNNITNLIISEGLITIGKEAFRGCANIIDLTIPSSVTSIGMSAFQDCTSLTNVIILDGLKLIDEQVFLGCTNIINFVIPSSVTSIESSALNSILPYVKFSVDEGNTVYSSDSQGGLYQNKTLLFKGSGVQSFVVPDGVTHIAGAAFSGCIDLTSVTIPTSVTRINGRAFSGCTGLNMVNYSGTVEQFNAITGASNITATHAVVCTDGTIAKTA